MIRRTEYELMLIAHPDLDRDEGVPALIAKVHGWIEGVDGEITYSDIWGRRRLAYKVRKNREGTYVLIRAILLRDSILDLERDLKLEEEIIRYLITRAENPLPARPQPRSRPKPAAAPAEAPVAEPEPAAAPEAATETEAEPAAAAEDEPVEPVEPVEAAEVEPEAEVSEDEAPQAEPEAESDAAEAVDAADVDGEEAAEETEEEVGEDAVEDASEGEEEEEADEA